MAFDLKKLLIDVFSPLKDEKVLIMRDLPHDEMKSNEEWDSRLIMAKEWHSVFKNLGKKLGLSVYPLLSYKATGAHNASLPKYGYLGEQMVLIEDILGQISICVVITEYSATAPLIMYAKKFRSFRVASLPGVSKSMEKTGLSADYKEIARNCSILLPKLQRAIGGTVEFSTGHKLYVDLRNRNAEKDDGWCHWEKMKEDLPLINLPSGEVFKVPYEGEDFEIGDSKTSGIIPVTYDDELVVYKVDKNRIIEVVGKGQKANKMTRFFEEDDARRNIAEFGLGCNDKAVISDNILESEKVHGFHWAYGRSEHLGGIVGEKSFKSPKNVIHVDTFYTKDTVIKINSIVFEYPGGEKEKIMKNSEYTIF